MLLTVVVALLSPVRWMVDLAAIGVFAHGVLIAHPQAVKTAALLHGLAPTFGQSAFTALLNALICWALGNVLWFGQSRAKAWLRSRSQKS